MLLTWQLWNALCFPQRRHPIFNYARKEKPVQNAVLWRVLWLLILATFIIFAILAPVPAIAIFIGAIILMPLVILVLNGTVLGIVCSFNISDTIATTHQDNRFELLSLSSQGTYGVLWLLCSGVVHRRNRLKTVYRIVQSVIGLVLVLLGVTVALIIFGATTANNQAFQQQQLLLLRDVMQICLLICALWLDHIQSILVGVMVGLVLPAFIKHKTGLLGMTPIIYLAIQFGGYLLMFMIYALIGIVFRTIFGDTFIASLMIALLAIVSFYLIREIIIAGLWRVLLFQYDISLDEYRHTISV